MNWIKDRAKEPSTYLGLSALIYGAGTLAKVNEAPAVADAVASAAPSLASGDWTTGLMLLLSGALGIFMKEKGGR